MVDHHVDRPGVEVPRGMELTGTNRSIGLIVLSKTHERFDVSDNDVFSTLIFFVDLVVLPRSPHPIPSRTRSLSSSGPMVLRLKARESRSPPGLPSRSRSRTLQFTISARAAGPPVTRLSFEFRPFAYEGSGFAAGWSSPVARQAHNLKVTGSNPVPAPTVPILRET